MSPASRLWRRWRRFAHRAAEVQSHVLLFLVYFVMLLPIALVSRWFIRQPAAAPRWKAMERPAEDLVSARNQF